MRKGYILLVVAAVAVTVIYHNYSLGFFTLTQAIVWFFLLTFFVGLLIEVLSKLKKAFVEAKKESPRKA